MLSARPLRTILSDEESDDAPAPRPSEEGRSGVNSWPENLQRSARRDRVSEQTGRIPILPEKGRSDFRLKASKTNRPGLWPPPRSGGRLSFSYIFSISFSIYRDRNCF